jgi:amidase
LPRPARPFAEELGRDPGRLRVGFSTEPLLPATVHPDCQQAVRDTAALLEGLGHDVVEAAPRIDGRAFAMDFLILIAGNTWAEIHEAEAQLGKRARARDFEPLTWLSRQMARAFHAGDYIAAKRRLEQNTRPVHEFFTTFDVLLTPTLSAPPLPLCFMHKGGALGALERLVSRLPPSRLHRLDSVLEQASRDAFSFVPWTPVMNVTGQPSMSVPLQWNEQDLPIGSLFTAAVADDALLLRLVAQLETARPWARRRPPSP